MKKLLKIIGFGFLALIVLGIIAVACTDTNTETSEPTKTEPVKEEKKVEKKKPAAKKNDPGISMAEFEQIKSGMTYEEVVKIIGGEGEVQSEVGAEGDEFYTVAYAFKGEKGFGSNAILMFQGGKLDTKAQAGLK